jgi:hypothetical protein
VIVVHLTREEYDFWLTWMADSWPQFRTDRGTESEVAPWWFGRALLVRARRRAA